MCPNPSYHLHLHSSKAIVTKLRVNPYVGVEDFLRKIRSQGIVNLTALIFFADFSQVSIIGTQLNGENVYG